MPPVARNGVRAAKQGLHWAYSTKIPSFFHLYGHFHRPCTCSAEVQLVFVCISSYMQTKMSCTAAEQIQGLWKCPYKWKKEGIFAYHMSSLSRRRQWKTVLAPPGLVIDPAPPLTTTASLIVRERLSTTILCATDWLINDVRTWSLGHGTLVTTNSISSR